MKSNNKNPSKVIEELIAQIREIPCPSMTLTEEDMQDIIEEVIQEASRLTMERDDLTSEEVMLGALGIVFNARWDEKNGGFWQ